MKILSELTFWLHAITHRHEMYTHPDLGSLMFCRQRVLSKGMGTVMWEPADRPDTWIPVETNRALEELSGANDLVEAYSAVWKDEL